MDRSDQSTVIRRHVADMMSRTGNTSRISAEIFDSPREEILKPYVLFCVDIHRANDNLRYVARLIADISSAFQLINDIDEFSGIEILIRIMENIRDRVARITILPIGYKNSQILTEEHLSMHNPFKDIYCQLYVRKAI